jgi:hypothetical protein
VIHDVLVPPLTKLLSQRQPKDFLPGFAEAYAGNYTLTASEGPCIGAGIVTIVQGTILFFLFVWYSHVYR